MCSSDLRVKKYTWAILNDLPILGHYAKSEIEFGFLLLSNSTLNELVEFYYHSFRLEQIEIINCQTFILKYYMLT